MSPAGTGHPPGAEPSRGRFRSFLLGTLKHFASDESKKVEAQKRGGGQALISLDWAGAEGRFQREPADEASPDRLFECRWALTLLDRALDRLRAECAGGERSAQFEELQEFITGGKGSVSYAEAAVRLGISLSAVKSAILRLRRRYHELVREEVGRTVSGLVEVTANQANALKSTGPRTPAGKARSAQNAVKRGLFSKQVVMSEQEVPEWKQLSAQIRSLLVVD